MGWFDFLYRIELPHRVKTMYIYLHDRQDKKCKAWPDIKTIAADLSLSRSTVKRAIKDLEKVSLIRKSRTTGKMAVRPRIDIICFKTGAFTLRERSAYTVD